MSTAEGLEITNKKIVKIIVHYEELYMQRIIKNRINKNNININVNEVVLANIVDIEDLLVIINYDENIFNEIILETIRVNNIYQPTHWRGLETIIDEYREKYGFKKRLYNNILSE